MRISMILFLPGWISYDLRVIEVKEVIIWTTKNTKIRINPYD